MSPAEVRCPTCEREVEWSEASPCRPFCSERCQLVDLGAWFGGERAIPGDECASGELDGTGSAPSGRSPGV